MPRSNLAARFLAAAVLSAPVFLFAPQAYAGECPAGQTGANAMPAGPDKPEGVTDTVIASIDLGKQKAALKGHSFRMRKLVVQPGGVVPWHSHAERPANIYIIEGAITEYSSTCAVPIEHKAGDVTAEFGPLMHWWKNNSTKPAVLISADILPPAMDSGSSM